MEDWGKGDIYIPSVSYTHLDVYKRQTKDRPTGRADDAFLVDKLLREKEGIFLWCLEGLHRLIGNNYQFSISDKARENMETVKRSSNNVIEFLQSEGYIRFKADSEASSKAIYEAYTCLLYTSRCV